MSGLRAHRPASCSCSRRQRRCSPAATNRDAAVAAVSSKPAEPEVSIVTVKPQPRAIVRELPGRIAPTRVVRSAPARLRHRGRAAVPPGQRSQGRRSALSHRPAPVRSRGAGEPGRARQGARRPMSAPCSRRAASAFLAKERAAPEIENEKAIAAEKEAAADVEGRKADLARARLSLDYATIRAPIDGIVGAALVQRRRAGGAERQRRACHHPAARSDLCRLHPVGQRTHAFAPRLRERRSRTHRARCRSRCASCSTTARSIRSPENCCSPKPRSTPIPGR